MADEKIKADDTQTKDGAEKVSGAEVVSRDEYEAIKKAQAGSDRAYQEAQKKIEELTSQFDDLKKRSLTEKERAELEEKKRREDLANEQRKAADATLRLTRLSVIADKGLPKAFEKYAIGSTEEEITESLNGLQTLVNQTAEELVKQRLKSPGVPRSGTGEQKIDFNTYLRSVAGKER